ncbi:hypothetical protein [Cupriavidus campinensis]
MGMREEMESELEGLRSELEDLEGMDSSEMVELYNLADYEDMCDGLRDRIEELEEALG